MSQIDSNAMLAIAARMVEQGIASVRAEATAALAQKDAELTALRNDVERLIEERSVLVQRIEELEDAAALASFELEAPDIDIDFGPRTREQIEARASNGESA